MIPELGDNQNNQIMIMNTKSMYIKKSRVSYKIYNSRTAGLIFMIYDLLDSSLYKNKNNSNLGKDKDNYLVKII
jgi:hypothetical protein